MVQDLQTAKTILSRDGYTCVVCCAGQVHTSTRRGVAPLLTWLEEGTIPAGFCAADKVVGKATAYLYCLLGARAVHAQVISDAALAVLKSYGIEVSFDLKVDYIQNRQKDGMCPMEAATQNCSTPQQALAAIQNALKALRA